MRKRTNGASEDSVFIDIDTAAMLTQLGKNTIRRLAQESNSARKIGKSYRINRVKLIDYIDSFET